jgi:hypothetical protein
VGDGDEVTAEEMSKAVLKCLTAYFVDMPPADVQEMLRRELARIDRRVDQRSKASIDERSWEEFELQRINPEQP